MQSFRNDDRAIVALRKRAGRGPHVVSHHWPKISQKVFNIQHLRVDQSNHPNFINKSSHVHFKINLLHGDNQPMTTVSIIKRDWFLFLKRLSK
jgi:hypothetical protein